VDSPAKKFLGIGWKFPIQITNNSMFAVSKFEEDIREAIWIIIATSKGERVMRPDFGCGIHDFVFETMNSTTISLIEQSVHDALILWEPRITIIEVKALTTEIDTGKLIISVDYLVNSTNNRFNLVYPFYLKEGG
jgi:phage baseplate assembly protein W